MYVLSQLIIMYLPLTTVKHRCYIVMYIHVDTRAMTWMDIQYKRYKIKHYYHEVEVVTWYSISKHTHILNLAPPTRNIQQLTS